MNESKDISFFGDYFKNSTIKFIKEINNTIDQIMKLNNEIIDNITNPKLNTDNLKQQNENFRYWLEGIKSNTPDNNNKNKNFYLEKIKNEYNLFKNSISSKINLYNEFKELINFDFSPPKEKSIKLFESDSKSTIDDNMNNFSISRNNERQAEMFYGSKLDISNNSINENNIKNNNENENKNSDNKNIKKEELKNLFLKSIENLIKNIILNCNYILEKEIMISEDIKNKKDNMIIKQIINYPYIKDENNYDSHINFLKNISDLVKDNKGNNLHSIDEDIGLYDINKELMESLKNVFKDKQFEFFKLVLNQLDNIEKQIEFNESFSDGEGEIDDDDEIDNDEDKENQEKKKLNGFYCLIDFISKNNINLKNDKLMKTVIDKINSIFKKILLDEEQEILVSFNNIKNLQDHIIRTEQFEKLELKDIKNCYPNLNEVYEVKDIIENLLINQCKIDKDLFDYKGNFIIPNKGYNHKGKEIYYPPNGWFGIGLKVLQKYENDEWINDNSPKSKWAIAYHGIDEGLEKLIKIINKGLEEGNLQSKSQSNDKRHLNKKIGNGVYLSPDINIAEKYSGIISFNKERYKIALMTKVMIDEIKEPDDINLWILNNKYVRIYRILFKKINKIN